MIKLILNSNPLVAKSLLDVQQRSYQVEAELIGFKSLPPLFETLEDVKNDTAKYLGFYIDDAIVAFLSYEYIQNEIDINKLVVDPNFFRQKIASQLLDYLIINKQKAHEIMVSTGAKNLPAIKLYQKKGFQVTHNSWIKDTLEITHLKRSL